MKWILIAAGAGLVFWKRAWISEHVPFLGKILGHKSSTETAKK